MTQPLSDLDLIALRARLAPTALDYLDLRDAKHSEWATVSSVATYCMNAEITEDEYVSLVLGSDFAEVLASENGRDRSDRLTERLHKAWSRVEEVWQPPIGSKEELRARLAELHARITDHRFSGRSGPTDRKVSLAIVEYCHEIGARTPMLSERFVAGLAKIGEATAHRALGRLERLGLLARHDSAGIVSGAQTWSINLGWSASPSAPSSTHSGASKSVGGARTTCSIMGTQPGHPVFVRSALGPTAGRLFWEFEGTRPLAEAELSRSLGIAQQTVNRNVRVLVDAGLFVKHAGRPARYEPADVTADDLDTLAAEFGVLDWSERQAARHERAREGYAAVLAFREQRAAVLAGEPAVVPTPEPASDQPWQAVSEPLAACDDPFSDAYVLVPAPPQPPDPFNHE